MSPGIPDGYREDALGRLVPESTIADHLLLADALVCRLVARVQAASEELAALKADLLCAVAEHVALVATQYDVDITGRTGDVRLESYDGRRRIERTSATRLDVGEQVHAAEALVRQYLDDETAGASAGVRALIARAFRRGHKLKPPGARLIDLGAGYGGAARWLAQRFGCRDAIHATDTVTYFRAYVRTHADESWRQVPLDFSAIRPAGEGDDHV